MSLVFDALQRLEAGQADAPSAPRPPAPARLRSPGRGGLLALLLAGPAAPVAFLLARGDAPAPAPHLARATPGVEAIDGSTQAPGMAPVGPRPAATVASPVAAAAGEATVAGTASAAGHPADGTTATSGAAATAGAVVAGVASAVDAAADATSAARPTATTAGIAAAAGLAVVGAADARPVHAAPTAAHAPTAATSTPSAAPAAPRAAGSGAVAQMDDAAIAGDDIHIQVSTRERAGAEEAQTTAVRQAIAELQGAQSRQDHDAMQAALARLGQLLPADSLTLLRMRAWAAHAGGDLAQAERLYAAIVDRVPDDRNAGINLALLQAGRGDVAQAAARLDRYALANGSSPELARAQALIAKEPR